MTTVLLLLLSVTNAVATGEQPPSSIGNGADIVVKSVRLTDNGDNDGFADPNETVNLFITLRNSSGADRDGIVVKVLSVDPTVDCILSPVISFGSLLAGQERESTVPAVFHVANVSRSDPFASLSATFDFQITGNDFAGIMRSQQQTIDVDLNVSGGFFPTTFTEGFEATGFGTFTTQSLDANRESLAASDGHRCQYNDPDFVNSNSYGRTQCFLGGDTPTQNGYDWHVHGVGSPDGGRAYLGNNALHWGVHLGAPSSDTTRLRQLDAIRTNFPVNLGWNGVTSELTFKQQVGLADCDYLSCPDHFTVDRGIVQVQLANSAALGVGSWRKIEPYENVYDSLVHDEYMNCRFDPTDDGNTEDDYFDPIDPYRRLGPSSTCGPEFTFSRLGATLYSAAFDPSDVNHASDAPGLQGSRGPGTWVQSKFDLSRYRGRRIRIRFLATSVEIGCCNGGTWHSAASFPPNSTQVDDGWYIDDVRVTNTLTSAATVSVDQADRSGLPACGPVCGSLTASLTASPPTAGPGEQVTLDASGSSADQCPGGTLLYRFWHDGEKDGLLLRPYDFVRQDWETNAIVTMTADYTAHEFVDVRCSTTPACNSRAMVVVPFVCPPADRAPLPVPILWASNTEVVWNSGGNLSDAIRGDLGALRASQGQFNGTVLGCMVNDVAGAGLTRFTDVGTPLPGEAFYYLAKEEFRCDVWSTGSPAEVPGAGGDRDVDLAYDPHICPSYY